MATGDEAVIALDTGKTELSAATQRYFDICEEKLGLVPNVLRAYSFDDAKLRAFTDMYNDLLLGRIRADQTGTGDDRGGGLVGEPVLLLPHRPRCRRARPVGRSGAG